MHSAAEVDRALADTEDALRAMFPKIPAMAVHAVLEAERERFRAAPIQDYVPVLVQRQARQRLMTHALVEA